ARTPTRWRAPRSTPSFSASRRARAARSPTRPFLRATSPFISSVRTRVMTRKFRASVLGGAALASLLSAACSGERTSAAAPKEPAPVAVHVAQVQSQPIERYLRVTGSLSADERADVAAETAGRVT